MTSSSDSNALGQVDESTVATSVNGSSANLQSSSNPEFVSSEPIPETLIDKIFTHIIPFNPICRWLGKRIEYFAPKTIDLRLYGTDFQPKTSDERGHFIPVRFPLIVEELLKSENDATAREMRSDFLTISSALYHYDALAWLDSLREYFAPFDPDSDCIYEKNFSKDESEESLKLFVEHLEDLLTNCNYEEIPREAIDRILAIELPGTLPVVADYSDFVEFRVFIRGVESPKPVTLLPSNAYGKSLTYSMQTLSRVCVYARLKRGQTPLAKQIEKIRKTFSLKDEADSIEKDEDIVVVKLFKDISLQDMKMVMPRVKIRFMPFDLIKIWGTFAAGSGSAIVKFIMAAAFNTLACCAFMFGFLLLMVRNFFKFINRRTSYMHRYASQLYCKSLASNFSAVNMLVTSGEEQEVKEFALGYFMALERGDWSTEEEIDKDAEAFLLDKFGLNVDFESHDALYKLRDKNLLEEREIVDQEGKTIKQYRVLALHDALRELDRQWDHFFQHNI